MPTPGQGCWSYPEGPASPFPVPVFTIDWSIFFFHSNLDILSALSCNIMNLSPLHLEISSPQKAFVVELCAA